MPDIQTIMKDDILSGIILIGGGLFAGVLILVILYHSVTLLFKR